MSSARVVAQALADWCGTREVDGRLCGNFYQESGSVYKTTVQGVSEFIRAYQQQTD
jgi:hypothetical protein